MPGRIWTATSFDLVSLTCLKVVMNSHRVHHARPDAEIYRLAAAKLRLAPESILFVDDKERHTNTQVTVARPLRGVIDA